VTRYRPSDALIAALAEVLPEDTGSQMDPRAGMWLLGFDLPGVGRIRIQKEALVEVEEPLPPEPPVGSVVLATTANKPWVFVREEPGWWYTTAMERAFTWDDVCTRSVPVLLVPDPLAEAPELPWDAFTGGRIGDRCVNRAIDQAGGVWVKVGSVEVRVDHTMARQMGLALLRAAAGQQEDRAQQEEKKT